MKVALVFFAVTALFGLGMGGAGVAEIASKESGTTARVKVTGCSYNEELKGGTYQCQGVWVSGGALVGGNGHVVIGSIDDADPSQVGKTITAHVSGDNAYTPSLRVPILLIVFGVLMVGGSGISAVQVIRGRKRAPATVAGAPGAGS